MDEGRLTEGEGVKVPVHFTGRGGKCLRWFLSVGAGVCMWGGMSLIPLRVHGISVGSSRQFVSASSFVVALMVVDRINCAAAASASASLGPVAPLRSARRRRRRRRRSLSVICLLCHATSSAPCNVHGRLLSADDVQTSLPSPSPQRNTFAPFRHLLCPPEIIVADIRPTLRIPDPNPYLTINPNLNTNFVRNYPTSTPNVLEL